MTTRRLLLLAFALSGCATVDVQCDMAIPAVTAPAAQRGEATIRWAFDPAAANCPPHSNGCALVLEDVTLLTLKFVAPSFSDVCALAKLGHEVLHAMKASH